MHSRLSLVYPWEVLYRIRIQQCIIDCYLHIHGKYYIESGYINAFSIVTSIPMISIIIAWPEPNIFVSRPAIVKIFLILLVRVWKYFVSPKYRICGVTIHKTHFFFYWIDFKDLYKIIIIFRTYSHTYIHTKYQSADILLKVYLVP
jgi:hypothetical protein